MKPVYKNVGVFLLFVVLTLVFTFPLCEYATKGFSYTFNPTEGNEVVPFQRGDTVQQYYHFWMAWDYVTGGPGPFFQDPYEFEMDDESEPIFTTRRLLISLVFLLMAPFGTVFAFNALLLLTLILNCFFAFLLAKHYTGKYLPSIVAGLIFGLCPFAVAQSVGGHTNGYLLFCIPFAVLMFEKGFQTNKSIYYLLTSLVFGCFALIEYHLFYYAALFFPPFFLFRFASKRPGWRPFFKATICMAIAAGLGGALMLFVKSFEIDGSIRSVSRGFSEVMLYTPSIFQFFHRDFDELEKVVYIGYFVVGAAFLSFFRFGLKQPLFWVYMGVFFFFFILCLGPRQNVFPLYRWFHDYLPYFALSRLPARMMVLVMLGAGMLVGLGLSQFKKKTCIALSLICFLIVGYEYFPRKAIGITLLPKESPVYSYIGKNIGDKNILCLPVWPGDSSWSSHYQYQITKHKLHMVNGYYPVVPKNYVEGAFYPLYSTNVGEFNKDQWELLKSFNVKYVVLHEEAYPRKVGQFPPRVVLAHLKNSPYLKFVMHQGQQALFELAETPQRVQTQKIESPTGTLMLARHFEAKEKFLVDAGIQILPPGEYVAKIRMNGKDSNGLKVRLLGRDPLKRENHSYGAPDLLTTALSKEGITRISFKLDKGMLVHFEVERPEQKDVHVERIMVTLLKNNKLPYELEAEKLFAWGDIIEDKTASGGQAVVAKPLTLSQQEMVYGPYREYPAGEYEATFWIKVPKEAKNNKDALAVLDVAANYGQQTLNKMPLFLYDFQEKGVYEPVILSFSLNKPEVLEFRARYLRKEPLYIDRIEITKK